LATPQHRARRSFSAGGGRRAYSRQVRTWKWELRDRDPI